jgi:hypothetical protein
MGLTRGQWIKFGRYSVCQRRISYDPASGMVLPAGKSAFRPLLSRRKRLSRFSSQLIVRASGFQLEDCEIGPREGIIRA